MFRAQFCAVLGLVMLSAASIEARELAFSLENRLGGDSNVFRSAESSNEKDDGYYEFAPRVSLRENHQALNYAIDYEPVYQAYFDRTKINGWDHTQRATADWQVTPIDTLGFSQRYISSRRKRLDAQTLSDGSTSFEETDRDRTQRSEVGAYYSRILSGTLLGRLDFDFDDIDFDNGSADLDSRSYGGTVSVNHIATSRLTVGLYVAGRYRESRGVGFQSTTDAYIGNVGVSGSFKVTPSLSLSVQGGPSVIRSEEELSDQYLAIFPGEEGRESTDTSFFATAAVDKEFERGHISLSYSRSESGNAGTGSSVVDSINLGLSARPFQYWTFRLHTSWFQSEVVANSVGPTGQNSDLQSFLAVGSAQYRITRQLSVISRLTYRLLQQDRVAGAEISNVVIGFVALKYNFEPWIF